MSLGHSHTWMPPGHLRPPDENLESRIVNGYRSNSIGPRTPQTRVCGSTDGSQTGNLISADSDTTAEDDPRISMFRDMYRRSEANINLLFSKNYTPPKPSAHSEHRQPESSGGGGDPAAANATATDNSASAPVLAPKKPARKLDDDDYDDYDDENDNDGAEPAADATFPSLKVKPASPPAEATSILSPDRRSSITIAAPVEPPKEPKKETLEDVRKKLEEDKKATEEEAKRSFHTLFYTLENDRDAMLDQERLDESERQVEAEMSTQTNAGATNGDVGADGYGSLSSANLGASSLTLKNLIARIDMKRTMVQASDSELRSLMSEVRKNRSKWASEDKVGQEELYEAAEKVLSELKAMTEHSTAFLTRVNKRDAPDYYTSKDTLSPLPSLLAWIAALICCLSLTVIKHPMDLGSMTKKLKALQYKSKKEFVDDLNLIWSNCLKYNTNPEHFLRKHALYMRKETEKLVPLIPEIVIRDRAEVEAEERRLHLAELDGGEESDDEPIMSSRGRKAPPKKGTAPKKTPVAPEGPSGSQATGTPAPVPAPVRTDSDTVAEGSSFQGLSTTPPPGTQTPSDPAGARLSSVNRDSLEIDGVVPTNNAYSALSTSAIELEDPEYNVWKQVTKKDRAHIAAERHRLLKGDKLNSEEPALLRTKPGMRRWLRHQKQANAAEGDKINETSESQAEENSAPHHETLAEEIEGEEDKMIPDYYDVMSGIPDLPDRVIWREDAEGNVVDASDEFLRILPKGLFVEPDSKLTRKIDGNMRQMQETRKVCSKIGIVKQMQLQSQVREYTLEFPSPFFFFFSFFIEMV